MDKLINFISIIIILISIQRVKSSYVHPTNNFFAQHEAFFQVGAAGTIGFGAGGPGLPSLPANNYPASPSFIPPQISPFPHYVNQNNHGWSNLWPNSGNELKPSIQSWETSYNVPCGDYTIHPLVVANVRYSSYQHNPQQFQPVSSSLFGGGLGQQQTLKSEGVDQEIGNQRQGRSFPSPALNFPFAHFQQAPPSSCSWKFKAFQSSCKLKFACSSFQLPALFRCDENYIKVMDGGNLNKKFCGSRKPRQSYSSESGSMQLYFHSQSPASLPSVFDCNVFCAVEQQYQNDATTSNSTASAISNANSPALLQNTYLIKNLTSVMLNKIVTAGLTPPKTSPVNFNQNLKYLNCKCGVRNESLSRIVGGVETSQGEFPWTAALVRITDKNRPYCGATLINDRWLITAAHCVVPKGRKSRENQKNSSNSTTPPPPVTEKRIKPLIEVLLNPHNLTTTGYNYVKRAQINRIVVHSSYNYATFDYDIALLRLTNPIKMNEIKKEGTREGRALSKWTLFNNALIESNLKKSFFGRETSSRFEKPYSNANDEDISDMIPICLPKPKERLYYDESQATVTGFGLLREGGPPSETMMQTQVQIFNNSFCSELYDKNNLTITQQMLCAGRLNGQMDSCIGDSGGPLLVQDVNGKNVLVGIVSWGRGCARPNLPGVYTNVAKFADWIYLNTQEDSNWCTY